eukprot:6010701-Pleurochrysis_carterae.AAC.1
MCSKAFAWVHTLGRLRPGRVTWQLKASARARQDEEAFVVTCQVLVPTSIRIVSKHGYRIQVDVLGHMC